MNNRLYGNLIFELSKEGRRGYSLPKNNFGDYEIPASMKRSEDANLPECDELTVVRHYTNLSNNNFGVDTGFYPLGSCTMKYNPKINEEMAALPQFQNLHPEQPAETVRGCVFCAATRNLATSYMSLAPMMTLTGYSLPAASMTTAREAPLNGEKLLMASPLSPTKNPLLLPMREPLASNVFKVNTDFVAFLTQPGCAKMASEQ